MTLAIKPRDIAVIATSTGYLEIADTNDEAARNLLLTPAMALVLAAKLACAAYALAPDRHALRAKGLAFQEQLRPDEWLVLRWLL